MELTYISQKENRMTIDSLYIAAILALIVLALIGAVITVYFIFKSANQRRQQQMIEEWRAEKEMQKWQSTK
jgi:F0F1-type ATP synthase assembly protein I